METPSAAALAEGLGHSSALERERAALRLDKALEDPGDAPADPLGLGTCYLQAFQERLDPVAALPPLCANSWQKGDHQGRSRCCAATATDPMFWTELESAASALASADEWTQRLGGLAAATVRFPA